jgi:hypothetical protein
VSAMTETHIRIANRLREIAALTARA